MFKLTRRGIRIGRRHEDDWTGMGLIWSGFYSFRFVWGCIWLRKHSITVTWMF